MFACFFLDFGPQFSIFVTNPRVVESGEHIKNTCPSNYRNGRRQKHLQMNFEQSKLSTSGSGQYSWKYSSNVLSGSGSGSDENGGNI